MRRKMNIISAVKLDYALNSQLVHVKMNSNGFRLCPISDRQGLINLSYNPWLPFPKIVKLTYDKKINQRSFHLL